MYEEEVAMVINLHTEIDSGNLNYKNSKNPKMPTFTKGSGLKDYTITREDIYGENSWLDKNYRFRLRPIHRKSKFVLVLQSFNF